MMTTDHDRPQLARTQETSPPDALHHQRPPRPRRPPSPPSMAPGRSVPRHGTRPVLPHTRRTISRSQGHLPHLPRLDRMPRDRACPLREVRSVGSPLRTTAPPIPRRMEPSTSRAAALRGRRERRTLRVTDLDRKRCGAPPRGAGRPASRGAKRLAGCEFSTPFWQPTGLDHRPWSRSTGTAAAVLRHHRTRRKEHRP